MRENKIEVEVAGSANGVTLQLVGTVVARADGSGEVAFDPRGDAPLPLRWDPTLVAQLAWDAAWLAGQPEPGLPATLDARQVLRDEDGREMGSTTVAVEVSATGTGLHCRAEVEAATCRFEIGERVVALEHAVRACALRIGEEVGAAISSWTLRSSRGHGYHLTATYFGACVLGPGADGGPPAVCGTVERDPETGSVRVRLLPLRD